MVYFMLVQWLGVVSLGWVGLGWVGGVLRTSFRCRFLEALLWRGLVEVVVSVVSREV